jgi:hypothetical protein
VRLPNSHNAVVEIEKLRDYSLNPNHPEGKYKARVFLEKLGFTRGDAVQLRQLILEAILKADAKEQTPTEYGRRFIVDFKVTKVEEANLLVSFVRVRSAWMIRNEEDFPRLTTCFIPQRSF